MTPVINWKNCSGENSPMTSNRVKTVGKGVEAIRIADESGAYRVIYVARRVEAVYGVACLSEEEESHL